MRDWWLDHGDQVPHQRWDLEQYYIPEARGDLTMYVRAASFVDGLDEFDAGLFRWILTQQCGKP